MSLIQAHAMVDALRFVNKEHFLSRDGLRAPSSSIRSYELPATAYSASSTTGPGNLLMPGELLDDAAVLIGHRVRLLFFLPKRPHRRALRFDLALIRVTIETQEICICVY